MAARPRPRSALAELSKAVLPGAPSQRPCSASISLTVGVLQVAHRAHSRGAHGARTPWGGPSQAARQPIRNRAALGLRPMTAAEEAEAIERLVEVFVPLGARQGCGYVADSGAVRAACRRLTAR